MNAYYPVVEVLPEWAPETENMGSKLKFWYLPPGDIESYWLFKYPRPERGEHWAEKIAAEVAGLLEIPCARVELAVCQGMRGAVSKDIASGNYALVHGNEILENAFPYQDTAEYNFHLADHNLVNIWLALDKTFESESQRQEAKCQFAEYLILDAVIGNTDRHSENWGVLKRLTVPDSVESIAPSYDHGSSLGRELSDERREQLLAENGAGRYMERGRGQIFRHGSRRRRPSPLQLIRLEAPEYPDLFRGALAKLDSLEESSLSQIVDSVPDDWMSSAAKSFAFELMSYSCGQLREVI